MPSFFNVTLPLPKKSKFNLSHDHASSHCVGTLDPVLCEYLPTNTDVDLSIQNVVRTSPAICPVFGSLRQDYHVFFVPLRLFTPNMRLNSIEAAAQTTFVDLGLPSFPAPPISYTSGSTTVFFKSHETSLWSRLGYGVNGASGSNAPSFSPIPIWAYYSIFYNYYANRQVGSYFRFGVLTDTAYNQSYVSAPRIMDNCDLEQLRISLLAASDGSVGSSLDLGSSTSYINSQYFRGGLCCRSRESDLFTTFLSQNSISAARAYSKITPASNGSITFDQIRTSSAITGFVERVIAAGGRYLDWLTVTSGVKTSHKCDIPEYIGSTSGDIVFDMITNVSGQDFGDLGGRGQGGVSGRRHRFTNVEPGFLMVIYSILPHVIYPGLSKSWAYATHLSDLYNTSLDRLTWQPLLLRNVDCTKPDLVGSSPYGYSDTALVGYQPAWLEETSVPSRSSGLLATTLRYWTLTPQQLPSSDSGLRSRIYTSPYCYPSSYQYIFSDPQQDNFFVYHQFRFFAYKQKSKNVLPRTL